MAETLDLTDLLQSTQGWLLLACLAVMLVLGILIFLPRRAAGKPEAAPSGYVPIEPANLDIKLVSEKAAAIPDAPDCTTMDYAVDDAGILDEVEVFIQFGYLDNAANALRLYVDKYAASAPQELKKLTGLYLQLGQIHDYADMLELQHDHALLNRPQLEEAIFKGLEADHNNLPLRVMAEQKLGLDIVQMNQRLGDVLPQEVSPRAEPQPSPSRNNTTEAPPQAATHLKPQPLIEGHVEIAAPTPAEQKVISTLLPPERQARILLACKAYRHALPVLERILRLRPGSLAHWLDVLCIHYRQQDLNAYTKALWHFHAAIGSYGLQLKDQLIQAGLALGSHPVLAMLATHPDKPALEVLGRNAGYTRQTKPRSGITALPLVEPVGKTSPQDLAHPLDEAEGYLLYGQLDMAIHTLEQAILANPQDPQPYALLLDLYDRQDELPRFTWLARQLKDKGGQLPSEVTTRMSTFVQRVQSRHQRQLAA